METIEIAGPDMVACRIALGTWAIGGSTWGGTNVRDAIRMIQVALAAASTSSTPPRSTASVGLKRSLARCSKSVVAASGRSSPRGGARVARREDLPELDAAANPSRGRAVPAAVADRSDRSLPGALAGPALADRGDGRRVGRTRRGRERTSAREFLILLSSSLFCRGTIGSR
jgi:hypothetical protein